MSRPINAAPREPFRLPRPHLSLRAKEAIVDVVTTLPFALALGAFVGWFGP